MDNKRVAKRLIRLAKSLVAKLGHTLWVTPKGKIIDLGTSSTHYDWIADNFEKLFPGEEFNDSNVFDIPLEYGWIHVRNHTLGPISMEVAMTGSKSSIHKNRKILGDIVLEGYENFKKRQRYPDDNMFVMISNSIRHRDIYILPDNWDELGRILKI
jgi:hypothetical protein